MSTLRASNPGRATGGAEPGSTAPASSAVGPGPDVPCAAGRSGSAAGRAARALAWLPLAPIVALAATRDLWAPDEPRYAEIAREIVERGDFLVLTLNGELYPDKPPLLYWLAALGGWLSGWSELALRVPALLATASSAWLCARFARRSWGEREAVWAVAFYLGTTMVFWQGGRLALDPLLSFFCLAAVYLASADALTGRAAVRNLALAGLCAGLGALAKGPVAWLHVGAALLVWRSLPAPWRPRFPRSRLGWAAFGALAIAPVAAWAVAAALREPALWKPLFFGQHVGRIVEAEAHRQPVWYHLRDQPLFLLPWTFLFAAPLARAWRAWRARRSGTVGDPALVRMAAWIAVLFVFFSAIPVKRELYLLPMYPAAALLCARELALCERRGRVPAVAAYAGGILAAVVGLALAISPWMPDPVSATSATLGDTVGRTGIVAVAVAVAVMLLTAGCALYAWRRGDVGRWAAAIFAGFALTELILVLALVPALNPRLSARELARELAARPGRPASIPCIGVRPEGYRFYGHVPTVRADSADDFATALARDGADFLALARDRDYARLPAELRARMSVVARREVGSRDILVLGAARPESE